MLGTAAAFFALAGAAAAEDAKGQAGRSLDGAWVVVCFEKNGQPQANAKGMAVKAEGGTIKCSGADGKPAATMKVAFGPNGTVQVTELNADATVAAPARAGVYVLTRNHLAISVNDDTDAPTTAGNGPSANSRCSVILQREESSNEK
jgi:hypothetical protein